MNQMADNEIGGAKRCRQGSDLCPHLLTFLPIWRIIGGKRDRMRGEPHGRENLGERR